MSEIDILGLAAGSCSTFALAPQALRVIRTREVHQLSLAMLCLMIIGALLWLSYGLVQADVSIILANAIALVFQITMMAVKVADVRRRTNA